MKKPREYLKKRFRTGARPTETDFGNVLDSFLHKDEFRKVMESLQGVDVTGILDQVTPPPRVATGLYNLDNELPLASGHYSLATAVRAVSEDEGLTPAERNGLIIQFHDGARWREYQYRHVYREEEGDREEFGNVENWEEFDAARSSMLTQRQYNSLPRKSVDKWYFITGADGKVYRIYVGELLFGESSTGLSFPFTFPLTFS